MYKHKNKVQEARNFCIRLCFASAKSYNNFSQVLNCITEHIAGISNKSFRFRPQEKLQNFASCKKNCRRKSNCENIWTRKKHGLHTILFHLTKYWISLSCCWNHINRYKISIAFFPDCSWARPRLCDHAVWSSGWGRFYHGLPIPNVRHTGFWHRSLKLRL